MQKINPELLELGKRVKKARKELSYTQLELAKETGIDRTYIGMIESGVTNVSYLKLKKLEEILGERF